MTDHEYDLLCILLSTKQVPKRDLEVIDAWLGSDYDDWEFVINWLWVKPDVPPKPRRRMKPGDYGTAPPMT
jgi:hypothetical protein